MLLRPTYAKVNLSAIKRNVTNIKKNLPEGTFFCAVSKADGYGHGSVMVAKAAIEAGAEWVAVAIPEEAAVLRDDGVSVPILVLGPSNRSQWRKGASLGLSMVVTSMDCVQNAARAAKEFGKTLNLHLKVDTGMNRVGVKTLEEAADMLSVIAGDEFLNLEGLMTHFATADEADKTYTHKQNARFQEFIGLVKERGFSPIVHAANSGGALDCPEMAYDMVRVGIAMYGCYPSDEVNRDVKLEPAMSLHTQISHIKTIGEGEKLSYGCTYTTPREMRIATLPIGYADGFNRLLSNKGEVLVGGKRAPVVGRVCMDQILIDVTGIDNVKLHDNVVCFGRQGGGFISVEEYAALCGTINYEILCALSPRVPRLYYEDEK